MTEYIFDSENYEEQSKLGPTVNQAREQQSLESFAREILRNKNSRGNASDSRAFPQSATPESKPTSFGGTPFPDNKSPITPAPKNLPSVIMDICYNGQPTKFRIYGGPIEEIDG